MKHSTSWLFAGAGIVAIAAVALAQTATPPPATVAAPPTVTAAPPAAEAGKAPPPAKPSASTPQHFEPTEKLRADYDVSFPIDI